jgi:hypothetical protein
LTRIWIWIRPRSVVVRGPVVGLGRRIDMVRAGLT